MVPGNAWDPEGYSVGPLCLVPGKTWDPEEYSVEEAEKTPTTSDQDPPSETRNCLNDPLCDDKFFRDPARNGLRLSSNFTHFLLSFLFGSKDKFSLQMKS